MDWKDAARKALVGDKVELVNAPGLWIRPKKLSTEVTDQLGELQRDFFRQGDNRAKVKEYKEIEEKLKQQGKTLEDADPMELLAAAPQMPGDYRPKQYSMALAAGIGEHNFEDGQGKLICDGRQFDKATVDQVLEWGPLAQEIFQIIYGYNFPLPKRSDGKSET